MTPAALQGWRARAALFALFFALNLALAWPTLRWPMVYDDLHLIRPLARSELLEAFHGWWDPDHVETEGYRPFTTVFNDARALAFGENVFAHRLFVIGLHALYLALLVSLACRIAGTSARAALAGGLFVLFSHLSVYYYVWLSDGVHVLQGLAFVGAGHLLLTGLGSRRRLPIVLSGVAVVAGSLVREDTLVVVPILVLLGLLGTPGPPQGEKLRRMAGYALGVGAASLALMGVRTLLVPQAPPPSLCLGGLLHRLLHLVNPLGVDIFDGPSGAFSVSGWAIVAALVFAVAVLRHEVRWQTPALWMLCAVVACSAATEYQRDNLLFFPLAFLSLSVATGIDEVSKAIPRGSLVAGVCAAWILLGGAYTSRLLAENFNPDSTIAISWNGQFIFGWARKARIPEPRRSDLVRRMGAIGIHNRRELRRRVYQLEQEAIRAGVRRPIGDGRVFYPLAALPRDEF
jgi:hypothetical protein